MTRILAIVFALLLSVEAAAQQAQLIEVSPDNFIGVLVMPDGRIRFIKAETIKTTPTDPSTKVTAAVYVYEKDQGAVPPQVAGALNAINKQALDSGSGFVAAEFEDDTVDGAGQVPDQFKVAREAALQAGLPCLVVLSGDKVVRTVKAPKTAREVEEAVKP